MISHKYNCIFIHIPKCAGTSIEKKLGHHDLYDGRRRQDHRTLRMIERPPLSIATIAKKDNLIEIARSVKYYRKKTPNALNQTTCTREQFETYYKFCVVRNPWLRAYSYYKNVMRAERFWRHYNVQSADTTFKKFIMENAGKLMLRPQLYWIVDYNGNMAMDNVIRFEDLQRGFDEVAKKLALEDATLPHELNATSSDYSNHYDDESIEHVAKVYREEIEYFNYSFQ